MVTAPIVLLMVVTTTPDGLAAANEVAAACLQALPPAAKTVVRTVPSTPDEATSVAAAAAVNATATVVVTWRDADHRVSDVHVRTTSAPNAQVRQTERTIVFSARDPPTERHRALGLVIASILDEAWARGTEPASPPPPVAQVLGGGTIDGQVPKVSAPANGAPPRVPPRWALEANIITAVDQQEDLDAAIGGLIALRRSVAAGWALRAGLGFRLADLDGASASARTTLGSLGVVWASRAFREGRRVGFAVRADLLGAWELLTRGGADTQQTAGQWTVGVDAVAQLGLGLSSGTSLLFSGGVEGLASGDSLEVEGQPQATIPRGRLIFELGVLSRF